MISSAAAPPSVAASEQTHRTIGRPRPTTPADETEKEDEGDQRSGAWRVDAVHCQCGLADAVVSLVDRTGSISVRHGWAFAALPVRQLREMIWALMDDSAPLAALALPQASRRPSASGGRRQLVERRVLKLRAPSFYRLARPRWAVGAGRRL